MTDAPITDADVELALAAADYHLEKVLAAHAVGESHGIGHAREVLDINRRALQARPGPLTAGGRLASCLAALLHDADDYKYFPTHSDYQNARAILAKLAVGGRALPAATIELVIRMISWVSASTNGDSVPDGAEDWMLYPRHSDRLAGSGPGGIYRCWHYTVEIGRPLYTESTLRAESEEDLWGRVATPARYAAYRGGSASMMDHYYDKLLHICRQVAAQNNEYLRREAALRVAPLVEVALEFGRTGRLSEDKFVCARAAALAGVPGRPPKPEKPGEDAN